MSATIKGSHGPAANQSARPDSRWGRLTSWAAVKAAFVSVVGLAVVGIATLVVLAVLDAITVGLAALGIALCIVMSGQAALAVLLTRQIVTSRRSLIRAQRRLLESTEGHAAEQSASMTSVRAGLARLDGVVTDVQRLRDQVEPGVAGSAPSRTAAGEDAFDLQGRLDALITGFERLAAVQDVPEYDVRILHQVEAMLELRDLVARDAPMPLSGGWAAAPTTLLAYLNVIREQRPGLVVECGSGSSSLWAGYALRALGSGRCVALEHDAAFHAESVAAVRRHGLEDWVEIRLAPLESDGGLPWYAASAYEDLADIDVVFVDGPPGTTAPQVRGAADRLLARCSPGAHFVLDDARRDDERAVVRGWTSSHGMKVVQASRDAKGWVVLRTGPAAPDA